VVIGSAIVSALEELNLRFPRVDKDSLEEFAKVRKALESEGQSAAKKPDGVAQVQVRRGGVEAGFHAQGASGFERVFEALAQVTGADDLRRAFLEQVHLFVYG
jgi:hypothetical protein